jgi:mannose-6-phosphate isomerase-like protein (cupin superfamily)
MLRRAGRCRQRDPLVKRLICGPGNDGRNSILYEGSAHTAVGTVSLAWAASEPLGSTEDLAATVDPSNLYLHAGETRFMRVEIAPGRSVRMHRTPHITEYMVVLSGELTMVLEDGSSAVIAVGDMLVQLGGMHKWCNEGTEPFVMAGVVIGVMSDVDVPNGIVFQAEVN